MVRVLYYHGCDLPELVLAECELEVVRARLRRVFLARQNGRGEPHIGVWKGRIQGVIPEAEDIGPRAGRQSIAEGAGGGPVRGQDADAVVHGKRIEVLPAFDRVKG